MSTEGTNVKSTNFIRNIINKDIADNLHASIKTRFPPEPNGYLHIGHAKSICLNFGLAQEYNGSCNLRFDDTNPAAEDIEYIDAIKQDVEWLGFKWDNKVKYSSNYFEQFYNYAIELINSGLAYVCFLNAEQMREYRGTLTSTGKNSPSRDTSIKDNLALFARMRAGEFKEGECVLRAKIDMQSSFICMRDPAIYRIIFKEHHQTAKNWCIYPMYDFAHCISDAIEGITHSLCTLEFQDNRRLYDWILDNLADFNNPQRPRQYEFSRLNLERTIMSKRTLQQLIKENLVSGWDDPRMPTISAMRRRGYSAAALRDFATRVGISKVDSITTINVLEAAIRDDLNIVAQRTMAVIEPIKLIIENYDGEIQTLNAPQHPQNEKMGMREIHFSNELYIDKADFAPTAPNKKFKRLAINKEVRLRNAYVIKAHKFDTDENDNITTIYASYDKDTLGKNPEDGRKVKGVIHFVEATSAIAAEFRVYSQLLSCNFDKSKTLKDMLNPDSLQIKHGFVEPSMLNAKAGVAYQFEREGYYCKDNKASDKLVFNKTVGLREGF